MSFLDVNKYLSKFMSTKLEERAIELVKNNTCLCCVRVCTLYVYACTVRVY